MSDSLRPVAVLCAAPKSIYRSLPGVEVWDRSRDAFKFPGGMPVVAHPPCRAWSTHCRHQAKPDSGERELGFLCAQQVCQWGGVLEQPAFSHLFTAAGLPWPEDPTPDLFTLEVWQAWWGYPMKKATWLCFSKIRRSAIFMPFQLHPQGRDYRREQVMSKQQRSATTPEFARWLVAAARLATPNPTR